jgi:flagellar protein FliJ
MKAFRFRLESVLRLRRLQVEAERRKLQELLTQERRWLESIAAADQEASDASRFVQTAGDSAGHDFRALAAFLVGIDSRRRTMREALESTQRGLVEQKKRLAKARLDERCLEKLRERRFEEWNAAAEREIERTVEELRRVFDTTSKEQDEAALDR